MRSLFYVYRAVAMVVGVLLIILTVSFIVKLTAHDPSPTYRHADTLVGIVGAGHGFLYIGYVILAFVLAARARWGLVFTVLMLAAGLIPCLIFWVERQVANRLHEDYPEIFETEPVTTA